MKKVSWETILALVVAVAGLIPLFGETYRLQALIVMGFLVLVLAAGLYVGHHWVVPAAFLYFMIRGAVSLMFPRQMILVPDFILTIFQDPMISFTHAIFEGMTYLTLCAAMLVVTPQRVKIVVLSGLMMLAEVSSVIIVFKFILGYQPSAFITNPGMQAGFIGCMIPFVIETTWQRKRNPVEHILLGTMICACLMSRSSTGIMVVILSSSAFVASSFKFSRRSIIFFIGISILVGTFGYLSQREVLFDSSGRVGVWTMAMNWWEMNVNDIWGAGLNSYKIYGPSLQRYMSSAQKIDGFFWMHNDWLQTLFETGFVGLFFVGTIFVVAIQQTFRNPALFASVVTFAGVALIQEPTHYSCFLLLGALLFGTALVETRKTDSVARKLAGIELTPELKASLDKILEDMNSKPGKKNADA